MADGKRSLAAVFQGSLDPLRKGTGQDDGTCLRFLSFFFPIDEREREIGHLLHVPRSGFKPTTWVSNVSPFGVRNNTPTN